VSGVPPRKDRYGKYGEPDIILWIIWFGKRPSPWWLYVDFLSVGSVGIKKIVVFVIIIIIFRAGTYRMGLCSRLAWLRRWLLYDSGCCLIFGFIRFCICVSGIIRKTK
jgi:hypothetical protein